MAELRQRAPPAQTDQESHKSANSKPPTPAQSFSWSNFSSWPLSIQLLLVPVLLLGIFFAIYWDHFSSQTSCPYASCVSNFHHGFPLNAVLHQAEILASHDWEYGTAAEAITELANPEKSVFGLDPFPGGRIPKQGLQLDQALIWVYQHISTSTASETLFEGDEYSVSDPAALGVAAVMVGQRWGQFLEAADRQKEYLLKRAPRYGNGAISHRREVEELWADAVAMVPPFLAYYAVAKGEVDLMKAAFEQIRLYREVLKIEEGVRKGLWKHIVGPSEMKDEGAWSTANGWVAYGMARVRATMAAWEGSNATMKEEVGKLDEWMGEIVDGAMRTDNDESGLLRNYLGDESWFGEASGTALLAAATYRLAVFRPDVYAQPKYLQWADAKRVAVTSRVDENGFTEPTVNPLKHNSKEPIFNSPEGASFVLMLASAWRDCVCRGICVGQEANDHPL